MIPLMFFVTVAVFAHGWLQAAACVALGAWLMRDRRKSRAAAYQRRVAEARAGAVPAPPAGSRLSDADCYRLDPFGDLG